MGRAGSIIIYRRHTDEREAHSQNESSNLLLGCCVAISGFSLSSWPAVEALIFSQTVSAQTAKLTVDDLTTKREA